jgi:hypothetical protein
MQRLRDIIFMQGQNKLLMSENLARLREQTHRPDLMGARGCPSSSENKKCGNMQLDGQRGHCMVCPCGWRQSHSAVVWRSPKCLGSTPEKCMVNSTLEATGAGLGERLRTVSSAHTDVAAAAKTAANARAHGSNRMAARDD